ncbi:MAG: MgtC/SapB family protein [Candidatus Aureabacteria bacterium]|nr:MgtC/SapB family protein [Candidatus Auribacterota bacterium]
MITELQMVLRLVIAAVLGGLVGFERERHHQPAGLRTHTILAIGSALAMCLSIYLATGLRDFAPNGDPARLAAQVISGIGFLGAGAILRYGINVRGLTTATSFWTVAIVGLAVGAGHYVAAVAATTLILAALEILDRVEKRFFARLAFRTINIKGKDRPYIVEDVKKAFSALNIETKSFNVSKDLEANEIELVAIARFPQTQDFDKIVADLSHIEGVKEFDVH